MLAFLVDLERYRDRYLMLQAAAQKLGRLHLFTCARPGSTGGAPAAPDGEERVMTGTALLARAFSHEMDHLDGLLFVDRLSPLKRDLMRRRLRKRMRGPGWSA